MYSWMVQKFRKSMHAKWNSHSSYPLLPTTIIYGRRMGISFLIKRSRRNGSENGCRSNMTLKSIMVRYYGVLKEDAIANQQHLNFKQSDSIPHRAQKYFIFKVSGIQFDWLFFPSKYRDILETKATLLITSNLNYDKGRNIPFELTIEKCATWFLITFGDKRISLPPTSPSKPRRYHC